MGYGQPLGASCRYELLGEANAYGTTITADASAHVKGAYTTLGTAGFDYDGFWLSITNIYPSGGADIYRVDIAANNGGSDQIIVADMGYDGSIENVQYLASAASCFIAVAVPKGATLKARCQATAGSGICAVAVNGLQGSHRLIRPFRALVNDTAFTNTTPTNGIGVGTGTSAWVEVVSSTSVRYAGIYLGTAGGVPQPIGYRVDVGWGAAASERVLFSVMGAGFGARTLGLMSAAAGPYPCDLPAGTRLACRLQATYPQGGLYPILYGLAA